MYWAAVTPDHTVLSSPRSPKGLSLELGQPSGQITDPALTVGVAVAEYQGSLFLVPPRGFCCWVGPTAGAAVDMVCVVIFPSLLGRSPFVLCPFGVVLVPVGLLVE